MIKKVTKVGDILAYIGSSALQTSVAGAEVIPVSPVGWTIGYSLHKFSFVNLDNCTVVINDGDAVYIPANQGFNTQIGDIPIESFRIVEGGIRFNWIGMYKRVVI